MIKNTGATGWQDRDDYLEAKILYKLTLGEVNTNIPEIGTLRARMTAKVTVQPCRRQEAEVSPI